MSRNDFKVDPNQTTSISNLIFSSRNNEFNENYQYDMNYIHEVPFNVSNTELNFSYNNTFLYNIIILLLILFLE